MTPERLVIDTLEQAVAILLGYGEPISEPISLKSVKVTGMSTINGKTNEPFVWPSGQAYAIVNFKAIAIDKYNDAIASAQEEDFEEAVHSKNLSVSVSHKDGKELYSAGRANIHIDWVDASEDSEHETVLRVVQASPVELVTQKKGNADTLMARIQGVEEVVDEEEIAP